MTDELLKSLPSWGLLVLAVVWVLVQAWCRYVLPRLSDRKSDLRVHKSEQPRSSHGGNGSMALQARQLGEMHAVIARTDEVGTPLIYRLHERSIANQERQTALLERMDDRIERIEARTLADAE